MTYVRTMALLLALGLAAAPAWGQKKPAGEPRKAVGGAATPAQVAPLPAAASPASSHAPYEAGECAICHAGDNPKQPGPIRKPLPELCLDCHEDFAAVLKRPNTHPPARSACTTCHNPHNSAHPKLLRDERPDLPEAFLGIAERATAARPEDRFESAGAMEAALLHAAKPTNPSFAAMRVYQASRPMWLAARIAPATSGNATTSRRLLPCHWTQAPRRSRRPRTPYSRKWAALSAWSIRTGGDRSGLDER